MIITTRAGKFFLPAFILAVLLFTALQATKAQCPAGNFNNTGFFPGFVTPTQPGITFENTAHAAWGGDYYIFDVTAGNTYVFRSCFPENNAINTVLSLYNTTGTTLLAFNDDFCGQQSQISWLATFTGQVRLSYYQSGCTTVFVDTKLGVYYTSPCTAPGITTSPTSATTCINNNTSFSIVATGSASLTYQWQVNSGAGFSNISNGGVYSNATTATLNITGAAATMNGYQYRCVVTNACGNITSNSATLTVNTTNNWTGAVNNNWHTAGNWSCGTIPGPNDDVVVSSGSPVIATGAIGQCRNLSKSGFVSAINLSGSTLQVYGNLNYTGGTFTTNTTSSLQFTGTTQQQLLGATPLVVTNMVVNNASGVVASKNITVSGTLSFNAGHLFTNNNTVTATTISGASASSFIITADALNVPSNIGGLAMPFNAGETKTFPIGTSAGNFNPAIIRLASGPAETFTLRMDNGVPAGATSALSVQKIWQITETTAGGNQADITLQWSTSHEGVTFNRNACGVVKSNGTNIVNTGYTIQSGTATNVAASTYQRTATGVTVFSPWGVTSDAVILPVLLTSFTLQKTVNNTSTLKLEITDNSTPAWFEIQRSFDGSIFSTIKRIDGTGANRYDWTDVEKYNRTVYYRLLLVDINGKQKLSNILRTNVDMETALAIFPVPVKDILTVELSSNKNQEIKVGIIDMAGKVCISQYQKVLKGQQNFSINTAQLSAGLYQLVVSDEQKTQSLSFIKN
jgi:Secretion system C-terminal sorting domain